MSTAKLLMNEYRLSQHCEKMMIGAWYCGECEACHGHGLIFGILEQQAPDNEGYIEGGFYCPDCKFSNAGKCNLASLDFLKDA